MASDPHVPASRPPDVKLRRVRHPFMTSRAIIALMLREISSTYGRSPGGYVWAVLEPAAGIALLTAIFSIGFRSPPLGTNFAYFYASGLLAFMMYADISSKIGQTISYSRALLEYPRITFVDAILARLILNTLTQIVVHVVVMGFIIIVYDIPLYPNFVKIVSAYGMVLVLSIGVGTVNSFLNLAFPVWQTAWAVLNRPLFLASCLIFLYEAIPEPYASYLWYNPLVHIVGLMRDGYYPYYQPTYISVVYPVVLGLALTAIGLFLLNRYHREILLK